jgi:flagellar biosynthesis chaperone FliJ
MAVKKHHALASLMKLREFALEKEEQKLGLRSREEFLKQQDCQLSHAELESSYLHTVEKTTASDYLRRDKCVREAGNRHLTDLRQLALTQRARQAQIAVTLQAKQRVDMIAKVLDNRRVSDLAEEDLKERKRMDDIAQTMFVLRMNP